MKSIRIGTRGSPLAMTQTNTVKALLQSRFPDLGIEIVVIKTSGDWKPSDGEVRLSEVEGGKGLFAKEIEQQLLSGDIDIAVHSMKDMDSFLPDGLVINHMLPREDARDAVLLKDRSLGEIPQNAVVGTASVRRSAFLKARRADLKIVPFRGNVGTRIGKLRGETSLGEVDCTLLAMAGLKRLGLADEVDLLFSVEEMLPAAGQGAVGIEKREGDARIVKILDAISCVETVRCVKAERAALKVLDGSCHTPIGAYAVMENGQMYLRVEVMSLDGGQRFVHEGRGDDAVALGVRVAEVLKAQLPDGFLA